MQSRPPDLPDSVVAAAVADVWELPVTTAVYRPVGYGSHHWSVADAAGAYWFVSVDVLAEGEPVASFGRLSAALRAAAVAQDAGLSFVVAPVPVPGGALLHRMSERYALALYPHVDGRSGSFSDALAPAEGDEMIGMLCALHGVPLAEVDGAGVDALDVSDRGHLEAALADLGGRWRGPYGDRLRSVLARHADAVHHTLRSQDARVVAAGVQTDRLVLTHGEPHPGNLISTGEGLVLIDWETALLAPPERDLWLLDARTGGRASVEYVARSGRRLSRDLLVRYRIAWTLADLGAFVGFLRDASQETADTDWSWNAFLGTLEDLAATTS